jgi:hypothetical protein
LRSRLALATTAAALAFAGSANAAVDARLAGSFSMRGVVTRADHIRGERRGQVVRRRWTFSAPCPTGPCQQATLTRPRARGTDTVALTQTAPGVYRGSGVFYVPVLCKGSLVRRGGRVPFTITVSVTGASSGTATKISATYANPRRTNLTSCPGRLGRDSARYTGTFAG